MKRVALLIVFTSLFFISCIPFRTLNSTTDSKPKESFLLGNNVHGKFAAKVTNTSDKPVTLWKCPIAGGKHSPITLYGTTTIKVEKNTALRIENDSNEQISVQLKVSGDIGLSMGYQK
jgi:hypothetical protein